MVQIHFEEIKKAAIASLKAPGRQDKSLPKKESSKHSTIYFFRHSQSYDNYRRIFSGRRQSHLTKKGIKQAKELAQKLKNKKIDLFITLPLVRCQETIKPIRKYHPESKIIKERRLLERDYGKLTGRSKIKLMIKNFKKAILFRRSYNIPPPDGESLKQVQEKRVFPFCRELEEQLKREKLNVAVCCTNNTMRFVRMYFENLSVEETLKLESPFTDYGAYIIVAE